VCQILAYPGFGQYVFLLYGRRSAFARRHNKETKKKNTPPPHSPHPFFCFFVFFFSFVFFGSYFFSPGPAGPPLYQIARIESSSGVASSNWMCLSSLFRFRRYSAYPDPILLLARVVMICPPKEASEKKPEKSHRFEMPAPRVERECSNAWKPWKAANESGSDESLPSNVLKGFFSQIIPI